MIAVAVELLLLVPGVLTATGLLLVAVVLVLVLADELVAGTACFHPWFCT